jgi:hypothetical protein
MSKDMCAWATGSMENLSKTPQNRNTRKFGQNTENRKKSITYKPRRVRMMKVQKLSGLVATGWTEALVGSI